MNTRYQPSQIESKWRKKWESAECGAPVDAPESYCIMLPPPNVTGSLHMGHAFQQTLMDILIRHQKMSNKSTLWQGGYDHAGIATQMMVERQLAKKGICRKEIGREAFLDAVKEWKNKSGNIIGEQIQRLGANLDWDNFRYTMDEGMVESTQHAFIRLHEEGLVYQGTRLVNWDPTLKTALSDLEVESVPTKGKLWHIRYPLLDSPEEHIIVATTRPETLLGDVAVAVHPDDARYKALVGKHLTLPLCGRTIPILADDEVDAEFGTGCVKLTPAHDFTDHAIGTRHKLDFMSIFDEDAAVNDNAPAAYQGLSREKARIAVVADLEAAGLIADITDHESAIPHGDRSGAILEPRLTKQWYLKMEGLAKPAIDAVKSGELRFVPDNWSKTYLQWLENIQDWCLSRQLWWGHRIPAWYDEEGNVYVGKSEADCRIKHHLDDSTKLSQDEDVLDTWFSSALWPFATLGWPEKTPRFEQFFPTQTLATGFDIIFFWVARMVMTSLHFTDQLPFKEVYIHGLIRDSSGQKMSKTKGNVIDPLDLIDGISLEALLEKRLSTLINPKHENKVRQQTKKQFPKGIEGVGTDALRFTFAALATTGRDINFDFQRVEGYRNFCNKLWNAARYIEMNVTAKPEGSLDLQQLTLADRWLLTTLNQTIESAETAIKQYRFDRLAHGLYEFAWHNFCDWYLEISKAQLEGPYAQQTRHILITVFERLLRLLHPIIPYITEEIRANMAHLIPGTTDTDLLANMSYPTVTEFPSDEPSYQEFTQLQNLITSIRRLRAEIGISPAKTVNAYFKPTSNASQKLVMKEVSLIAQLAKINIIEQNDANKHALTANAVTTLGEACLLIDGLINTEIELDRLEKQLAKLDKEKLKIEKMLSNEKYIAKAPAEVIQKEKEKLIELSSTIERLSNHQNIIRAIEANKK